jgi:hypothetical protein
MFNELPRGNAHGDGIFRGDSELEMIKQVNILEEACFLGQYLTEVGPLPSDWTV